MQQGNLTHHRWHGLWTEGSGQLETSSPVRRSLAGTGQPGRRRMKPNWNKQETGQPGDCEKAEGLMHVSMSYNDWGKVGSGWLARFLGNRIERFGGEAAFTSSSGMFANAKRE